MFVCEEISVSEEVSIREENSICPVADRPARLPGPARIPGRTRHTTLALLLTLAGSPGCVVQHPNLDSARLLEPGQHEILPYCSIADQQDPRRRNWSAFDDRHDYYQQFGFIHGFGTSPGRSFRTRFEVTRMDGGDEVIYFSGEPKFALDDGYAAFALPIGYVFNVDKRNDDDNGGWLMFNPTFMQTIPLGHLLEVNLAEAAHIYPWFPPIFGGLQVSVGASIGGDIRWWALRPEVGILLHPDEERVTTFSLGIAMLTPPGGNFDAP